MANTRTISAFQHVKTDDGGYTIILPFNSTDEVFLDFNSKYNLTTKLVELDTTIDLNNRSILDDLVTIMMQLSPFIKRPIQLNHVYADDLSDPTTLTVTKGLQRSSKVII